MSHRQPAVWQLRCATRGTQYESNTAHPSVANYSSETVTKVTGRFERRVSNVLWPLRHHEVMKGKLIFKA